MFELQLYILSSQKQLMLQSQWQGKVNHFYKSKISPGWAALVGARLFFVRFSGCWDWLIYEHFFSLFWTKIFRFFLGKWFNFQSWMVGNSNITHCATWVRKCAQMALLLMHQTTIIGNLHLWGNLGKKTTTNHPINWCFRICLAMKSDNFWPLALIFLRT